MSARPEQTINAAFYENLAWLVRLQDGPKVVISNHTSWKRKPFSLHQFSRKRKLSSTRKKFFIARSRLLWFYSMLWTVKCKLLLSSSFWFQIYHLSDLINLWCYPVVKRRFWDSCIRTINVDIFFMRQLPNLMTKTTNGSEVDIFWDLLLAMGGFCCDSTNSRI